MMAPHPMLNCHGPQRPAIYEFAGDLKKETRGSPAFAEDDSGIYAG